VCVCVRARLCECKCVQYNTNALLTINQVLFKSCDFVSTVCTSVSQTVVYGGSPGGPRLSAKMLSDT
jgi:hypothetical protein